MVEEILHEAYFVLEINTTQPTKPVLPEPPRRICFIRRLFVRSFVCLTVCLSVSRIIHKVVENVGEVSENSLCQVFARMGIG